MGIQVRQSDPPEIAYFDVIPACFVLVLASANSQPLAAKCGTKIVPKNINILWWFHHFIGSALASPRSGLAFVFAQLWLRSALAWLS